MSGGIPKYGENFRRTSVGYRRGWSRTIYTLKADGAWVIQANSTSEKWLIMHHNVPVAEAVDTFTEAMDRLLLGIQTGFYAVDAPVGHTEPALPSGRRVRIRADGKLR